MKVLYFFIGNTKYNQIRIIRLSQPIYIRKPKNKIEQSILKIKDVHTPTFTTKVITDTKPLYKLKISKNNTLYNIKEHT